MPSVSHTGESFTYQGSRIWFFGFASWTLDYSADLILIAFSISYGGEFYLRLCYFDLGPRCRLYPSSLQYLMRRRVIKSCASGSSALRFGPYSADLILFALSISRGGDRLPVTTHAFNHLIPWLCSLELGVPCSLFFLSSVSHVEETIYHLQPIHSILIHTYFMWKTF